MAKNKGPQPGNIEDYLVQVEWNNQQSQRRIPLPWYMEPKWKHKRVSSSKHISTKKLSTPVKIILALVLLYAGYFLYKNDIKILIALSVMGIFLFFLIRDAAKKPK